MSWAKFQDIFHVTVAYRNNGSNADGATQVSVAAALRMLLSAKIDFAGDQNNSSQ